MASTKRSVLPYALVCLSVITNVNCSPFMLQNASSLSSHTRNNSTSPTTTHHPLPPIHVKPAENIYNPSTGVVDDFIPTLNQLLSTSRTARTRRALSLKLLTLLLQDDPIPPTNADTGSFPADWSPPTNAATSMLQDTWKHLTNVATRPDTATKWSGTVYSVPGIPTTWNNGVGVMEGIVKTNMPTIETIIIEPSITPLRNVSALLKDFSGYDLPVDEIDAWPV